MEVEEGGAFPLGSLPKSYLAQSREEQGLELSFSGAQTSEYLVTGDCTYTLVIR